MKALVGEVEAIKHILYTFIHTLSSSSARTVTVVYAYHAILRTSGKIYMCTAIRLTVLLIKMVVSVIPQPGISFENGI